MGTFRVMFYSLNFYFGVTENGAKETKFDLWTTKITKTKVGFAAM
jgi:hypothetical protein